jgi:transcriptional regulator with GAF, ATPase, and Fis domain
VSGPSDDDNHTKTLLRGDRPSPLGAVVRVMMPGGATARLTSGSCIVGSAPPCDLIVQEPTVSRSHVELYLVPEGVAIRDLGSRNGTFYLGQRVEKMVLSLGARVQLGSATIAIDADQGALAMQEYTESEYRGAVGASSAMRRIFATLARLEGSLVTVLLEGESGAGKEVIARAVHEGSNVSSGALITVNCGAIPRDLVASELFGHKKGAFTGAVEARTGAFEEADGGTLFLDEIGELPLDVQPALLRALENGEIRPVGGDRSRIVKVRIVAATNRDLEEEIGRGTFREDLFYRLAVVRLRVPPLRERPEDIEPLARKFAAAMGAGELPRDVVERLKGRTFGGNARELRNVIQAYVALGVLPEPTRQRTNVLDLALAEMLDPSRPYAEQKEALGERFTKLYLEAVLARAGGNQTAAARVAGLDRSYLGRLLAKHGITGGR